MAKMKRTHYTAEEKVAMIRLHLVEGKPVSEICEDRGLNPNIFYRWQKEFFENGAAAFNKRRGPNTDPDKKKIDRLERKLIDRDEGLAELMHEHVKLKKNLA
jgi:transposase